MLESGGQTQAASAALQQRLVPYHQGNKRNTLIQFDTPSVFAGNSNQQRIGTDKNGLRVRKMELIHLV